MTNKRLLFIILSILWMSLIFFMSNRPGDVSVEDSYQADRVFGRLYSLDFDEWSEEDQMIFIDQIDIVIRKLAHEAEYAILAVFIWNALGTWERRKMQYVVAWLLATVYAASDEFHQLFVPGRLGMLSDVCIDSCGALAGVLLILLWWKHQNAKKIEFKKKN